MKGLMLKAALMSGLSSMLGSNKIQPTKLSSTGKQKFCLYDGKKHSHNNSFCSAECAKAYNKGETL